MEEQGYEKKRVQKILQGKPYMGQVKSRSPSSKLEKPRRRSTSTRKNIYRRLRKEVAWTLEVLVQYEAEGVFALFLALFSGLDTHL
jgi:hypothetical protein